MRLSYTDKNSSAQMRFEFYLGRKMSMKIWGLGSITRSFILAATGTIFTYCVLVYGLTSINNNKIEKMFR